MITGIELCRAVEAVELHVQIGRSTVRALVMPDVLQQHFAAEPSPNSWLKVCNDNAAALDVAVERRWRTTGKEPVLLTMADF